MSRRSFPRIAPEDLRDHADEARIARVWERLEQDLPSIDLAPRARAGLVYVAIAATFAAFGGGLLVGKLAWNRAAAEAARPVPVETSSTDVFAAGTQSREVLLPGRAKLTLSPGAVVERDNVGGAARLKLLQGEVAFDSGTERAPLAIAAGEAVLNTQGASAFRVRHRGDDMDVNVTSGSVTLTTPAGASEKLGKDEHREGVRLHKVVASPPIVAEPPHVAPPLKLRGTLAKAKAPGMPDWRYQHDVLQDDEAAYALLSKQGIESTISSAKSANDLMVIADIMRTKKQPFQAQRALTRVVEAFSGAQLASVAAMNLSKMYRDSGRADLADDYSKKVNELAQKEDSLACNLTLDRIRRDTDNNGEAARAIKEYLANHPDGVCKDQFNHAGDDAPAASEPVPVPPAASAASAPSAPSGAAPPKP